MALIWNLITKNTHLKTMELQKRKSLEECFSGMNHNCEERGNFSHFNDLIKRLLCLIQQQCIRKFSFSYEADMQLSKRSTPVFIYSIDTNLYIKQGLKLSRRM